MMSSSDISVPMEISAANLTWSSNSSGRMSDMSKDAAFVLSPGNKNKIIVAYMHYEFVLNMDHQYSFAILLPISNYGTFTISFNGLTSSHQRLCIYAKILPINRRTSHSDFCVCGRETCQHTMHGVPSWRPWGPRQKALQTMNEFTLCWFLPNPFIQDLFLWHTSQEFVKTDLYPLSRNLWSLSGMLSVRPGTGW